MANGISKFYFLWLFNRDLPVSCCISAVQLRLLWNTHSHGSAAKDFGTTLLQQHLYLAIQIPSVVVPGEYNYLINPLHPEMRKVHMVEVNDRVYDLRIKIK